MNTDPLTRLALSRVKGTNRAIVAMGYDSIESNIVLSIGDGNKLPDPLDIGSYDLVWWNASDYLNPANDPHAEIVKCIAKVGDTIIIMRSQDGRSYDKNIFGKTYGIAPLPIGNNSVSSPISSLSYYNIPQPHNHTDGNSGGTLSHTNLSNIGTNTHANIDTHITNAGSMSLQSADAVTITGGAITNITDLAVADGGTGISTITGIIKGNGTAAFSAASAGNDFVAPNGAITGATNTKITYDTKGLVTSGASATLASADFANQGTTTTLLHGNAAANPSWGSIVTNDITAANVTYAKIQNVSATDMLLGRVTSGAGTIEEIACTAAGRALLNGADAAAQKTTLSLNNVTNVTQMPLSYLDTDITLAANSDTKVATQKAVKAYSDQLIGAANATVYKGVINCSGNPDYPAASAGWLYRISVAGKIGGASGLNVEAGDMIICLTTSASGNQATVGSNWNAIQANIDGAVIGPVSSTDGNVVKFSGTTGKLVADSGLTLSGTNTGDQTGGTPALTLGTANTAGSSPNFIRRDDTILVFDATSPSTQVFGDAAAVGSATAAARRDHKHAMMALPAIDATGAATDIITRDATTSAHGLVVKAVAPASGLYNYVGITNGETAYTNKALFDATSPSTQAFADSAVVGTATVSARRDHKHAMMAAPTTVSGNAGSATLVAITNDTTTNATMYPTWVSANTGNLAQETSSTKLTFNPSTGMLTASVFSGPLICPIVSTGISYSALSSDYTIVCTAAPITITIPVAAGNTGKIYNIKHNATSGTIAITSTSNIDAATTYNMLTRYETVCIQSNGTQWFVI